MDEGERGDGQGMLDRDRKRHEPIGGERGRDVLRRVQFPYRFFYDYLPNDGRADVNNGRAVLDRLPRGVGEEVGIVQPPEEDMGVEE